MNDDTPPPTMPTSSRVDPEVWKKRVKLSANGFNAIGLALLIGSIVAPIVDAARRVSFSRSSVGVVLGLGCVLAAMFILRYIKRKEAD